MEKTKIESFLLKSNIKLILVFIIVVLSIYVYNGRNIEKVLFDEDKNLRNKISILEREMFGKVS